MIRRLPAAAIAVLFLASACARSDIDASAIPTLPATSPAAVRQLLAVSERPVVLNVWASWCVPCRSEAPLLERAARNFGTRVRFVGVNVRDSQSDARRFIAEFYSNADIEHLYDRTGAVPPALGGGLGVPLTFFFEPGGDLVELHFGVIDERTLALQIDELLGRSGS